jgi:hypothetical protein
VSCLPRIALRRKTGFFFAAMWVNIGTDLPLPHVAAHLSGRGQSGGLVALAGGAGDDRGVIQRRPSA